MTEGPSRWRVFLPDPWTWEGWMLEALESAGCALTLGPAADDPAATPLGADSMGRQLRGVDGVVIHSREAIPAEALECAERLLVIAKMGIGVERIDVRAAGAAGILVTNTPVAENYQGIAEATVGLILALLKHIPAKDRLLRSGGWRDRRADGELLSEQTIGIVGLGRVGGRVADLLSGWPVSVLATDPVVSSADASRRAVEMVPLRELLARSTVVTLHAARSAGDPPIIGAGELAAMRDGAHLVNTARGGLVDEAALVAALRSGRLAGAALDVFASEPLAIDHPLRTSENVILTPHTVGTSRASQRAICQAAVDCCLAALRGEVPPYVVNPDAIPAWRKRWAQLSAGAPQ
jgi:D-3-phosphoglycerate dehydrogenase